IEKDINNFCKKSLKLLYQIFHQEKAFVVTIQDNNIEDVISDEELFDKDFELELKKIINSSLPALNKWFKINKDSFISKNEISNFSYPLNQLLNSDYLIISPSFFQDEILALIILTKKDNNLTQKESDIIKIFSDAIAFGIKFISIRNNFTLIENKLANAQKFETIGKLASGFAHDFNNLLATIFGSISLLKNKVANIPNALNLIENIENSSNRARDLVKGILSFGKPTQQRKEIVFLDNIFNELSKVIQETFPKSIKIVFDISDSLFKVVGNSTEIYQILLNLCVNAKEAIVGEGSITIKAENFIVDNSNIYQFPNMNIGHYVKISVSDTGVGISEENLSKIFEPYFSTKQKDTGSGLGLFITSQLVKDMNGYIDVESKLNVGTTFKIFIPAVIIKEQSVINTKEKIIMIADDEEMLNDLLGDLLESNGFYVLKVNNTNEIIRILSEELKVDLLIIDYNLPEINGIECVMRLREMGLDMPVIVASGVSSFNNEELKKAKINKTIQKPYDFETILEEIKRII
ncbi:MAG: ATP-binding protein, partial [Ignavibacterium sp.]|nr:ATP-binding protein [Ignavibacterium sp.]MDW8374687.1 ATP-binding protein [Ignavibacteriales bacterium]